MPHPHFLMFPPPHLASSSLPHVPSSSPRFFLTSSCSLLLTVPHIPFLTTYSPFRVPTYQEAVAPLADPDAAYNASWHLWQRRLFSVRAQRYAGYGLCPDGACFEASTTPSCLLVSAGAETKTENCSASTTSCPPEFVKHRGLCYLLRAQETDVAGALRACTLKGASLAFPKDMDTLLFLVSLVEFMMTNVSATPPLTLHLGMNNAAGDWTLGGLYTPTSEVVGAMGPTPAADPPLAWRLLSVPGSGEGERFSVTASSLSDTATHVLCQLHGPIWCKSDPPLATSNMTLTWNGDHVVGTLAEYSCAPGFFMDGNITVSNWTMQCLGQLGEWFPQPLPECRQANVCLEEMPTVPSPLIWNTTDENVRYLYGTAQYWCPEGMATAQGMAVQNVTCSLSQTTGETIYSFTPAILEDCTVCALQPTAGNATTDWTNTTSYAVGQTVTASCIASHHAQTGQNSSLVECTETGWANVSACYKACVDSPPEAGTNMTRENFTDDHIGVVLSYDCAPGFWLQTDQENPALANQTTVTCNSAGVWEPARTPLRCVPLCTDDPPVPPDPAASDWDGYNRSVGHQIAMTCPDGQLFEDLSAVVVVACEASARWTNVSEGLLVCTLATNSTPILPANLTAATQVGWPSPPYLVGSSYNVTCAAGTMTPSGKTFMTTNLTADGWTAIDSDFICYNEFDRFPQYQKSHPVSDVLPAALLDLFEEYGVDAASLVSEDGLTEVTFGNMTVSFGDAPYIVGSTISFRCITWKATRSGETSMTVMYTPDGWEEVDPDFVCNSSYPAG
ncbi:putative sushi domain-containing protein 1 [Penaeus vannamei]|uniref:Putative sushi domain-containing protein 1 n=1 Tax=Penaeus vannamei TaxID=6689 RepID=A0A3R7STL0_PENVA|nr:putative sushi domain-containing protein 1 [Penaeus vannamei]